MNYLYLVQKEKGIKKGKMSPPMHIGTGDTYKEFEKELREYNAKGYGVFRTVHSLKDGRESRKTEDIGHITSLAVDIDFAKDEWDMTPEKIKEKKESLINELREHTPPTFYIDTKNGLHAYWMLEEPIEITDAKVQAKEYSDTVQGIIDWTVLRGSEGDPVKDLARYLRVPTFNHMKSDAYLCEMIGYTSLTYTMGELKDRFPSIETPTDKPEYKVSYRNDGIESIPVTEIYSRAMLEARGKVITWDDMPHPRASDENGHRGVFVAKDFQGVCGQSSTIPANGTKVSIVQEIFNYPSGKDGWLEALAWIKKEFGISDKPLPLITKPFTREEERKRVRWFLPTLHKNATFKPTQCALLAGSSSAGKTTFIVWLAEQNSIHYGVTTLFLSIEETEEDFYEGLAMKYAGISSGEDTDALPDALAHKPVDERKLIAKERRKKELIDNKNIIFRYIEDEDAGWKSLEKIIQEECSAKQIDLIVIDNLNEVEPEILKQPAIATSMRNFSRRVKIPTLMLHHTRVSNMADSKNSDPYSTDKIAGTHSLIGKFDIVLQLARIYPIAGAVDMNAVDYLIQDYKSIITSSKGRAGAKECFTNIYFLKGMFYEFDEALAFYKGENPEEEIFSSNPPPRNPTAGVYPVETKFKSN